MTIEKNYSENAQQVEEDPFVALAAQEADSLKGLKGKSSLDEKEPSLDGLALNLTPSAVARLIELKEEEKNPELTLRIRIYSGGCSGYRSEFSLEQVCAPNDIEISQDGAKVVIDKISARMLGASELDFTNDIVGEGFALRIAKAHSACGCGVSFGL